MSQGPSFWFDTRVYLAVSAALLLVITFYNTYVAVLGGVLLYALYRYGRDRHIERQKEISAYLDFMSQNLGQASFYALQNLPLAIAIVDEQGALHWRNSVLADWAGIELDPGANIRQFAPEIDIAQIWGRSGLMSFHSRGRYYQLAYKTLEGESEHEKTLSILCVSDITSTESVRMRCEAAMPVIAYIQIDNYHEALQGLSDSQRSAILTEINRHLMDWVGFLDGFIKKYSEDLYIAVFDKRALEKTLADKFGILDEIRAVHHGNRFPLTLSIGVAADEATMAALGQRAQAGLDLALGRGGDQAVVYLEGKAQFYGGKAKAVEKSTRVKARIVAQALRDVVADAEAVMIMGHATEDYDSLGAALGVCKMAAILGKPAHIVVSQPGIAVDKLGEVLAEYDRYQGIFITPDQAEEMIDSETLLFVVDTHRPTLTAAPGLLPKAERIIVIDHHRRAEDFILNPFLVYLEPSASSTSELITELLIYYDDKIELTRLEASALYAGIVVDTKSFATQTGVRTFEAASYLRLSGADPRLVRQLFRVDFDTLKHRAEIINNTELLPGGIVVATYSQSIKDVQLVAAQAADMLLNIEGVRVSFVLFPLEDGVAISARSQGDINVQVIMEELGGGGHQTVAGAQIKGADLDEVKEKLAGIAAKYVKESEKYESNPPARG